MFVLGILGPLMVCAAQKPVTPLTSITLNGQGGGRIFDGIGALSAGASSRLLVDYPEPYRSQILDYLFKPDYGAALQSLKVEIGADVNSTDGSEPSFARTRAAMAHPDFNRGYEWWLMEQAQKRNPHIFLDSLAWGAPGWIGHGHFASQDMANYVSKFIEGAKSAHHLDMQYTGVRNETPVPPSYVVMLKKTLLRDHLSTRVVCCDLTPGEHEWRTIASEMSKNPEFRKSFSVFSAHAPDVFKGTNVPETALKSGKPLWASEDEFFYFSHGLPKAWSPDAEALAMMYNLNYIRGRITATQIWSLVTSYYNILAAPRSGLMTANAPWSGHYKVLPMIWVTAQTTQFTHPGWQYINSDCGYLHGQGTYVTLKSPSGKNYSVIIETVKAKGPQRMDFHITGGLSQGTVHVWETNATKTFEHVANIQPHNGAFSINLEPDSVYSLTTTTGQHKGNATPPPSAPFPFPYVANFQKTELGQSPRYFSDQDGAFEVHRCTDRSGRCLEQMVTQKPIAWHRLLPNPFTLLGSVKWKNYSVKTDAMLEQPGEVALLGRIDSANSFKGRTQPWPSCYVLLATTGGGWKLLDSQYKAPTVTLASGKLAFPLKKWDRLELKFKGSNIQALINGKRVASVKNTAHSEGMAGVGSGWHKVEFDHFKVQRD